MQTFIAITIVLLAVAYLVRMWLPVVYAKNDVRTSSQNGDQSTTCSACSSCGACS